MPSYREWILPAQDFHGLWECLYFDSSIKRRLLKYAASALVFADHRVNSQLISWNRWGCWAAELLGCWAAGQGAAGLLACWPAGPLGRWAAGLLGC